MSKGLFFILLLSCLLGCGRDRGMIDPRLPAAEAAVHRKFGKSLAELPVETLVLISPHNENMQNEYEWAFNLWHATEHGTRVDIQWRSVGGGTSTILQYLRNVYSRTDSAEIDVLWGGGENVFQMLAAEGILAPLTVSDATLSQIPELFGGVRMYGADRRWCGAAISGFGFLYNRRLLEMRGVEPPTTWEELGDPRYFRLLALADPTQSGSAAAAYEMIVQSAQDWPAGWARLLDVLSNAKRFYDSAGDAANAPLVGEAMLATCIDFYGALRVKEAPDVLVYHSPAGQTAFTPDPIAVLRNPPHPVLAQRFAEFVLSLPGQAMLGLPVGAIDGPIRNELGRQPIRRDAYKEYAGQFLPWIVNPYQAGNELQLDLEIKRERDVVLKHLVQTAAIDNGDGLKRARQRLLDTPPELRRRLTDEFRALPPDVATRDGIMTTATRLRDATEGELIISGWQHFFRNKYERIARADK